MMSGGDGTEPRFVTKSIEGWRARGHTGVSEAAGKGDRRVNGPAQEEGGSRGGGSASAGAFAEDSEGGCTGERG